MKWLWLWNPPDDPTNRESGGVRIEKWRRVSTL